MSMQAHYDKASDKAFITDYNEYVIADEHEPTITLQVTTNKEAAAVLAAIAEMMRARTRGAGIDNLTIADDIARCADHVAGIAEPSDY